MQQGLKEALFWADVQMGGGGVVEFWCQDHSHLLVTPYLAVNKIITSGLSS